MGADLKFRNDETFTIVQLTDMHVGDGIGDKDEKTAKLVRQIIASEKPDLIVLTGDMIWSQGAADPCASFRRSIAPVIESGVPWSAVFGNHDAEEGVTREKLLAIQQESDSCLSQAGPEDIGGVGNYVIRIKEHAGDKLAAALYFLDSGSYAPEAVGGYEWIQHGQVLWYLNESAKLREIGGSDLPAICFFHIPLPEYDQVWRTNSVYGTKFENVECPKLNTGMFAAMVNRGDIMGVFVGHDHDNDYCGTLYGIRLCYGRVTGYNCYGKLQRGARVIRLREGQREFDTWLRLENEL